MNKPRFRPALIFPSPSSKLAAALLAVIVLASVRMVIAASSRRPLPDPRATVGASQGTPAMALPASAHSNSSSAGQPVRIALQIVAGGRRQRFMRARLLRRLSGTTFTSTRRVLRLRLTAGLPVQMATAAEIKPGAVVQASGTVDKHGSLTATDIVLLSGYVRVR